MYQIMLAIVRGSFTLVVYRTHLDRRTKPPIPTAIWYVTVRSQNLWMTIVRFSATNRQEVPKVQWAELILQALLRRITCYSWKLTRRTLHSPWDLFLAFCKSISDKWGLCIIGCEMDSNHAQCYRVWVTAIWFGLVISNVVFFLELHELFFSPCQVSLRGSSILFGRHMVKNDNIPLL